MTIALSSILNRQFLTLQLSRIELPVAKTVAPDTPIIEVISLLSNDKSGAALVTDPQKNILGIVSERDLVQSATLEDPGGRHSPVTTLMKSPVETAKPTSSLARALHAMAVSHYRHLPVVGQGQEPHKMLSTKGLIDHLHQRLTKKLLDPAPEIVFDQNSVDEFFASTVGILPLDKALVVEPTATVHAALEVMRKARQGAVIVYGEDKTPGGIFTERDYIMKVLAVGESSTGKTVGDVMTLMPRSVLVNSTIALTFELLSAGGFRHLPVVNTYEQVIGAISVRTIMNFLASAIVFELDQK